MTFLGYKKWREWKSDFLLFWREWEWTVC